MTANIWRRKMKKKSIQGSDREWIDWIVGAFVNRLGFYCSGNCWGYYFTFIQIHTANQNLLSDFLQSMWWRISRKFLLFFRHQILTSFSFHLRSWWFLRSLCARNKSHKWSKVESCVTFCLTTQWIFITRMKLTSCFNVLVPNDIQCQFCWRFSWILYLFHTKHSDPGKSNNYLDEKIRSKSILRCHEFHVLQIKLFSKPCPLSFFFGWKQEFPLFLPLVSC